MANVSRHKPGDDSIDEVNPKRQADGTWTIRWMWWPYDGADPRKFRHQGKTAGEARSKARAKATELREGVGGGRWTKASKIGDYIEQVSAPAITASSVLSDDTKSLYGRSLVLLREQFRGKAIAKATEPDTAISAIEAIAAAHGRASAKTARNVLSKWVFTRMKRSKIITANPLLGEEIDYGTVKMTTKPANDVALAAADYDRVLDHLLEFDASTVELPPRSRESARLKLRRAVDLTMLQMTTGMRLGSARQVEPHEVVDNVEGGVNVYVPPEKLKGRRKSITFTVLDDRVAKRMKTWRDETPEGSYVFGSPADRSKLWDRRNATRVIENLYTSLADELGIDEMQKAIRSHGWRTTLNVLYYHLPSHVRAEWFGHSAAVNEAHYVADRVDLSPMVAAAKQRRGLHAVGE